MEKGVKRLLMCSGKVFYELRAERAKQGKQNDIHIIRLEQVGLVVWPSRRGPLQSVKQIVAWAACAAGAASPVAAGCDLLSTFLGRFLVQQHASICGCGPISRLGAGRLEETTPYQ